ncbi:conserved Plasmodium protein, unknown function [Plasmodium knowlesi strain H]|uniref:Uncharacterized protein n=3 Tax=Plasmodium knowlesi TaxID=5850 RepID=A0A5K1TWR3_PLAKH|nr:conserved Plasmodium protein, unknown function [Plasmodium knowlesi strain H]OTN64258.1 Uncharacterized protein PKNOH_S140264800 [Plasmodium knowlesi]CAA9991062.1 conserved Plasmodium protein, unknown function [Plasmodium knowlesi strain H]SBO20648.1 conserved Plasmodium protein, unknown function [Plasmodium knowlesi strain H]SBO21064.1 conserved Plasmodium protein, unknown function [Plasmodium knowlesi strain H]VVS80536.1 conserved Plasmodium protein, unknown function [Plasmodium knowlesi |eukprot:XP_002262344.1 hypothetical protein, conserved in Plasmodium species [Plasmodium knowlesi strain H]
MKPVRRRLAKRITSFYKNVSANAALFATNLLLYHFDRDLIATLVQTYKRLLKKHEKEKTGFHEEYLLIFNYIIFSHVNFVLPEFSKNNTPHFDIAYDLSECTDGTTPLLNARRLIKRGKCNASKLKRLRIKNGTHVRLGYVTGETPHSCRQGEQNGTSYKAYQGTGRRHKHKIAEEPNKGKQPDEWNRHICDESHHKRVNRWESKLLGRFGGAYGRVHIREKGTSNYIVKCITNTCMHNCASSRFPFCASMECFEAGESQLVEQLKKLYVHVHYWRCLMELNVKCRRTWKVSQLASEEKNIYEGIYKNIYYLFKRMNRMHFQNIQMINRKKQQLSITHNCEMENLISETKVTTVDNSEGTEKINELVFKHIAEKEALCRHAEHEVKVMQLVNLKEYKEHIFYIFNIIHRERNVLSLPPLPVDELEEVDAVVSYKSIRAHPNGFCPSMHKERYIYFARIVEYFHLFYLYKLIKSNVNVMSYLHLYVKHSLCDTLRVSVIFSLGEVEDIFLHHSKNNEVFKERLYGMLSQAGYEHYACRIEGESTTYHCTNQVTNEITKLGACEGDRAEEGDRTNGTPLWMCAQSKYFDARGQFKSKLGAVPEERAPFNGSYDSTHKYVRDNSSRFLLEDNTSVKEESYTHLNKISLREKPLNGLVLYLGNDTNGFCKDNVYQSIFNLSMNKTDFVFPTLKEQLDMFHEFVSPQQEMLRETKHGQKCSPMMGTQLRCGNIIITRHKNLKIGMGRSTPKGEKKNKKKNFKSEEGNGGETRNTKSTYDMGTIKNSGNDLFNLEIINKRNFPSSIMPIYEQLKKNSQYFMNKEGREKSVNSDVKENTVCKLHENILKKKKKKIHVDIIFHVIIPKNVNRKSFKIILLSLLKILDLCRDYHVSSLTCPLPYVHNVVYKNKRPVLYAFMYSIMFSLLNYIKFTQSSSKQVSVLHFVFPNLTYREGGTKSEDNTVEKNKVKNTPPKEGSTLDGNTNLDRTSEKRMSSMASFIQRVATDMGGRYMLVESIYR